jgi:hypothetical protein
MLTTHASEDNTMKRYVSKWIVESGKIRKKGDESARLGMCGGPPALTLTSSEHGSGYPTADAGNYGGGSMIPYNEFPPPWWEPCGTPQAEASMVCPPCWRGESHPFHHSPGMPVNTENIEK